MNELAVQGANDTNESIDRDAINEELDQLTQELDRISTTTQFNKQNLLDGTFTDRNLHVGANANQKIVININNMNSTTLGLRAIKGEEKAPIQKGQTPTQIVYKGNAYTYDPTSTLTANQNAAISQFKAALSGIANEDDYAAKFNSTTGSIWYSTASGVAAGTAASAMAADLSAAKEYVSNAIMNSLGTYLRTEETMGADSPVGGVGEKFTLTKPGVDTYSKANATIQAVQDAINKVSSQRSALGAIQNRLEHTIANLDNVAENTQAAESRIRDLDMASEMVEYSKNNILAQAGQSMLAQANQATQGVLSLLQ